MNHPFKKRGRKIYIMGDERIMTVKNRQGEFDRDTHEISLNIYRMIEYSDFYGIPFERIFSHIVSHEHIHNVLEDFCDGDDIQEWFDDFAGIVNDNVSGDGIV